MAAGGVEVDVFSVELALFREEGDIWVALRSPVGPEAAYPFGDAVAEADDAQPEDGVFSKLVTPTPFGAAAMLRIPNSEHIEAWMADVAERLERRGMTGSLAAARSASYPDWAYVRPPPASVSAFLAWSFDRDAMVADIHRTSAWYVPATATARICRAVAEWGARAGDEVVVGGGFRVALRSPAGVAEHLSTGLRLDGRSKAFWHQLTPRRARLVALTPGGRGVAQVLPPEVPWPDRVDALRRLVTALPDLTDLAFVRTSHSMTSDWGQVDIRLPLPHVGEVDLRHNKHLLDRWVPDAHGVQVLTDAHLEGAHDLSAWSITHLGHRRHLVEAPDLAPWYTDGTPDEATLAQARADFGGMILTPQIIEAHPLPPPG